MLFEYVWVLILFTLKHRVKITRQKNLTLCFKHIGEALNSFLPINIVLFTTGNYFPNPKFAGVGTLYKVGNKICLDFIITLLTRHLLKKVSVFPFMEGLNRCSRPTTILKVIVVWFSKVILYSKIRFVAIKRCHFQNFKVALLVFFKKFS